MAVIYYPTTSNFSTAVPQKVVASQLIPIMTGTSRTACNSEQTIAFTADTAGTLEGVFICLSLTSTAAGQSFTIHLEKNDGGWADVAGVTKTLTYAEIAGTYASTMLGAGMAWVYFAFGSTTAITTDADTWRIKVQSTNASGFLLPNTTSGFNYGIVITATTTYSSSDDILIENGITITVDQSITAGNLIQGVDSILQWTNPPAASYTLTVTRWFMSASSKFLYGSSDVPIAAAVRGTLSITNMYLGQNFFGNTDNTFNVYGVKPTNYYSYLNADAAASQKVIVTTVDMSASWTAGDILWIYGSKGVGTFANHIRSDTIGSISGTSITMTNNLPVGVMEGWAVINITRFNAQCGFVSTGALNPAGSYGQLFSNYKLSGASLGGTTTSNTANGYNAYIDTSRVTGMLVEDCILTAGNMFMAVGGATGPNFKTYFTGNVFQNIFIRSLGGQLTLWFYGLSTITNCWVGTYIEGLELVGGNFVVSNCGMTDAYSNNDGYVPYYLNGVNNSTFTSCKAYYGAAGIKLTGVGNIFTNFTIDGASPRGGVWFFSTAVNNTFTNCAFGQKVANTGGSFYLTTYFIQAQANNCTFDTVPVYSDSIETCLVGSFFRSVTHNTTANDNRSWWLYGKLQSVGDGLPDTTRHTTGTGKFALRFGPLSSTDALEWEFIIPTGDISTQTMTVACWVKINSATYYAGTHQNPKLTINYDDGTTSSTTATDSTSWQLLAVNFTPTTAFGEITITVDGYTDATGSDAYFYVDDMAVLYPAGYKLDLGGLDLWANALPIVPPIATVISAQDFWSASSAVDYGSATMGEKLAKKVLTTSKFLGLR